MDDEEASRHMTVHSYPSPFSSRSVTAIVISSCLWNEKATAFCGRCPCICLSSFAVTQTACFSGLAASPSPFGDFASSRKNRCWQAWS